MIAFDIKKNGVYRSLYAHHIKNEYNWNNSHRKDGNFHEKMGIFDHYAINGSQVSFIRIMSANGCKIRIDII